ncbi:MAG: DUF47 domain-containing protein [Spirochaetae bacterium HGW-Spirochaetae-1]|jgi:hypothetical protein|nr:MAG: DUF47 domain-containing protein [Spirochaetae bacterium HGW-Spirochaetae-1]
MHTLFNRTNELIRKIDQFIDLTAQSSLLFKLALKLYLEKRYDEFENRFISLKQIENQADAVRKDIESQLYEQTLIPESRGDVLGLLENMDYIADSAKSTMLEFSIERPWVPENIGKGMLELAEPVNKAVESLVYAVRAYFYDINAVKDHLHLVKFYEREADTQTEKIKRDLFAMDIELACKTQLGGFIRRIDNLADEALQVADRLNIATIKRVV